MDRIHFVLVNAARNCKIDVRSEGRRAKLDKPSKLLVTKVIKDNMCSSHKGELLHICSILNHYSKLGLITEAK